MQYTSEFRKKIIGEKTVRFKREVLIPCRLMDNDFFEVDNELASLLINSHRLLGILDGMIKYMPNSEAIRDLMILKECYYSRSIDYEEPPLLEALASLNAGKKDYEHISYVVTAYKAALGRQVGSRTLPETCTLAMYGEEPEEKVYLRKTTIEISNRYDPTPPSEILPALNDLAMFISKRNDMDILAKAALAHFQVEAIHPFEYYNGIVGRIMIYMILHNAGYLSASYLCLSQYLYHHTNDYFYLLRTSQYSGGYHVWVKFFVQGIQIAAKQAIEQIEKMQQIIAEDEAKIKSCNLSTKSTWMVYNYFKHNLVSEINVASAKLGLSYNAVAKSVNLLCSTGILAKLNNQLRHRLYEYTNLRVIIS